MVEYRIAKRDEYQKLIAMANYAFMPEEHTGDLEKDAAKESYFPRILPKLYQNPETAEMHRVAVDDGEIVGIVGSFPMTMHVLDETLSVMGIGTVSVHPKHRRDGHMISLMNLSIENAEEQKADFMILDGRRQRYGHWGFEKAGLNPRYEFDAFVVRQLFGKEKTFGYTFRKLKEEDTGYLQEERLLRTSSAVSVEHEERLEWAILNSMDATPYVVLLNNEFVGTFMFFESTGRISDIRLKEESEILYVLNDWIHVLMAEGKMKAYAEKSDVKNAINGVATENEAARETRRYDYITVNFVPLTDRMATSLLAKSAESVILDSCQSIRIMNYENVIRAFLKLKASFVNLPDGQETLRFDNGERLTIRVKGGKTEVIKATIEESRNASLPILGAMDAVDLLFGQVSFITDFGYELTPFLRSVLPLPFHWYASDEV